MISAPALWLPDVAFTSKIAFLTSDAGGDGKLKTLSASGEVGGRAQAPRAPTASGEDTHSNRSIQSSGGGGDTAPPLPSLSTASAPSSAVSPSDAAPVFCGGAPPVAAALPPPIAAVRDDAAATTAAAASAAVKEDGGFAVVGEITSCKFSKDGGKASERPAANHETQRREHGERKVASGRRGERGKSGAHEHRQSTNDIKFIPESYLPRLNAAVRAGVQLLQAYAGLPRRRHRRRGRGRKRR